MNYEEKLRLAKEALASGSYDKETIEYIFPELRESEDEKIRKAIKEAVENYWSDDTQALTDILAWLEKQDEQMPVEQDTEIHDLWVYIREWNDKFGRLPKDEDELAACIDYVMKRQKPADEIEPKFKVGDWITNGEYTWKVTAIQPLDYILQSQNGNTVDDTISHVDEYFHLWTIQDAKDGDVLANGDVNIVLIFKCFAEPPYRQHIIAHIGLDAGGDIQVTDEYWNLGFDCGKPATKEQRDILFQKMKEVGYEWDADKKELKKIEQGCYHNDGLYYAIDILEKTLGKVEGYQSDDGKMEHQIAIETVNALYHKKPAEWSEEDKLVLKQAIYVCHQNGYTAVEDWLKSLKPNHWKPSEFQLECLKKVIPHNNTEKDCELEDALTEFYNDLKKL